MPVRFKRFFSKLFEVEALVPGLGTVLLRLRAAGTAFPMLDSFELRLEDSFVDDIRGRFPDDSVRQEAAALTARVVVHAVSGTFRAMLSAGTLLGTGAKVVDEFTVMAVAAMSRWT